MATAPSNIFDAALSLNAEAFRSGRYEAAYHFLMASLHLAEDFGDEAGMLRVAKVAGEQGQFIDSLSPPHNLSSQAAKDRGHVSVFVMAARQAGVQAKLIHEKPILRRLHEQREHRDQHDAFRWDEAASNPPGEPRSDT